MIYIYIYIYIYLMSGASSNHHRDTTSNLEAALANTQAKNLIMDQEGGSFDLYTIEL